MGNLESDLAQDAEALRETHISWVFMHGTRVYKVKKPVDLGFLDFTSQAQRRCACESELELNRRLAPGVYLGLRPVLRDATGKHRLGDRLASPGSTTGAPTEPTAQATVVDWAVEMRRLCDDDAADARLRAGQLSTDDVERVARRLVQFHTEVRSDETTAGFGSPAAIEVNVAENFEQSAPCVPVIIAADALRALQQYQRDFVTAHAELLAERARSGYVRDGHGDLRLEHVYLSEADRVEIIDCIEFNDRFRYADVCSDLAFLAMDLRFNGQDRLAEWLLSTYALHANDYGLYALTDFYESYRAHVRAKVTGFTASDPGRAVPVRERAAARSKAFFQLAARCAEGSHGPRVVVGVGGLIASGKSTLAHAVAAELGLPLVEADRTRKHLAGVAPAQPLGGAAFAGDYSPEATARTYAEVLRRADATLASGRAVVVDASFRAREGRDALRELAAQHDVPALFVECRAEPSLCRARLEQRARGPHVSDGRLAVFDDFVRSYEAPDELPANLLLRLDTARPLAQNLQAVLRRVQALRSGA